MKYTSNIGTVRITGVRDTSHLSSLVKAYATVAGIDPETVTVTVIGHIRRVSDGKDFSVASFISHFTKDASGEILLVVRVDGLLQLFRAIGELEVTLEV